MTYDRRVLSFLGLARAERSLRRFKVMFWGLVRTKRVGLLRF